MRLVTLGGWGGGGKKKGARETVSSVDASRREGRRKIVVLLGSMTQSWKDIRVSFGRERMMGVMRSVVMESEKLNFDRLRRRVCRFGSC